MRVCCRGVLWRAWALAISVALAGSGCATVGGAAGSGMAGAWQHTRVEGAGVSPASTMRALDTSRSPTPSLPSERR